MPHVRLVLGHVHRQLDELPHRGARAVAARQRLDARDAQRAPRAVPRGGADDRRPRAALLRRRGRHRGAAVDRDARRVLERDDARRRDGRLDQHRAAHPGRRAGGRGRLHARRHRRAQPPRAVPVEGRAEPPGLPHGGRAPRRGHPRAAGRARPGRPAGPRRHVRAHPDAARVAGRLGRPGRARDRARGGAVPRRARRGAHHPGVLHLERLGLPRHRRRERLHPRPRARLHRRGRAGGAARQPRRGRRDHQDRGHRPGRVPLRRPRAGVRVAGRGGREDPHQAGRARPRRGRALRGPRRRPRHAGDAVPDVVHQGPRPGQGVRAHHRRPVLRRVERHLGGAHQPRGRRGRHDRPHRGRRRDRDRRRDAPHPRQRARRGPRRAPRQDGGAREPVAAGRPRPLRVARAAGVRRDGDGGRPRGRARREPHPPGLWRGRAAARHRVPRRGGVPTLRP